MSNSILVQQSVELFKGEEDRIATLGNISSLIFDSYTHVNWVGFYFFDKHKNNLVLGPFQGKVACTRIPLGKGVCGTSFSTQQTQVVADVHSFTGHIACDSASASEIVIPLKDKQGSVLGVLDLDSPLKDRFTPENQQELEALVNSISEYL